MSGRTCACPLTRPFVRCAVRMPHCWRRRGAHSSPASLMCVNVPLTLCHMVMTLCLTTVRRTHWTCGTYRKLRIVCANLPTVRNLHMTFYPVMRWWTRRHVRTTNLTALPTVCYMTWPMRRRPTTVLCAAFTRVAHTAMKPTMRLRAMRRASVIVLTKRVRRTARLPPTMRASCKQLVVKRHVGWTGRTVRYPTGVHAPRMPAALPWPTRRTGFKLRSPDCKTAWSRRAT